jgi:hypothetical protein
MHLVDNLFPLSLRIADNKTTEHFINLLCFSDRVTLLGLEISLYLESVLFQISFSASVLFSVFRELKKRLHFPSDFNQSLKGLLYVQCHSVLINNAKDGNNVDKLLFIVPIRKSGYLEVSSIWHLDLDLLGFIPFV